MVKTFPPLYDATLGDHKEMFEILKDYLSALDLSRVGRIVFCGDGGPWIGSGVESLCEALDLDPEKIAQVLDYTHAKQNLNEIVDLVPEPKQPEKVAKKLKKLLWNGDIQGIYECICHVLKGHSKTEALKKWESYFDKHRKRMQYASFEQQGIPCGSGCVESAIRRVINMRLKSPGIFWIKERAEYFLFLRSQLLSGRWLAFIQNVSRRWAAQINPQVHKNLPRKLLQAL